MVFSRRSLPFQAHRKYLGSRQHVSLHKTGSINRRTPQNLKKKHPNTSAAESSIHFGSILIIPSAFCFTLQVTTVNVDGRYQYKVTSANDKVKFRNVRFSISGRAKFSFDLAGESSTGGATFTGVEAFVSYLWLDNCCALVATCVLLQRRSESLSGH